MNFGIDTEPRSPLPAGSMAHRHFAPTRQGEYGRIQATPQKAMGGGFDAANPSYWDLRWQPKDSAPDADLANDLPMLRERCIDLVKNDPLAYGVLDTIAHGVVGRGPRLRSTTANPDTAATIERLFAEWTPLAGWDGVTSFADILTGTVHAANLSGDVGVLWPDVGDGTGPRLDLIDARRINTPGGLEKDDPVRLGVQYDKYGRVQGYYVAKGENLNGPRQDYNYFPLDRNGRVNMRLFKRPGVMRPRQSRQWPMFAPAALDLKDLREYRRTEVRRAQMASKSHLVVKTPDPKAIADAFENIALDGTASPGDIASLLGRSFGTTPDGNIMVLGIGEDAIIVQPPQVNGGTGDYMESMLRAISSCTGLPFEEAFRLYAKLNYSNARTIRLMAKAAYKDWRDALEAGICRPTVRLLVQYWWALGLLGRIPWSDDLTAHAWGWDEMEWVDPAKEVGSNADAIATGQKSIKDIASSIGKDWRTIVDDNLEAEAYEAAERIRLKLPPKVVRRGVGPVSAGSPETLLNAPGVDTAGDGEDPNG